MPAKRSPAPGQKEEPGRPVFPAGQTAARIQTGTHFNVPHPRASPARAARSGKQATGRGGALKSTAPIKGRVNRNKPEGHGRFSPEYANGYVTTPG